MSTESTCSPGGQSTDSLTPYNETYSSIYADRKVKFGDVAGQSLRAQWTTRPQPDQALRQRADHQLLEQSRGRRRSRLQVRLPVSACMFSEP
jgi:hypothetical protein